MNGQWDLGELYASPGDPAFLSDKKLAVKLADRVLSFNRRRDYVRLKKVIEKIDTYSYLLQAVDGDVESVRRFCAESNHFTEDLLASVKPALEKFNSERILNTPLSLPTDASSRYNPLLSSAGISPKVSRMLYDREGPVRKRGYQLCREGYDKIGEQAASLYSTHLKFLADNLSDSSAIGVRKLIAYQSGFSLDTIDSLLGMVKERRELVAIFYKKKGTVLNGAAPLGVFDLYAPARKGFGGEFPFEKASLIACRAADGISKEWGRAATLAFKEGWVDYLPRSGKRGGAFTHPGPASGHPYIFLNFTSSLRDVFTLSHELFHAIHFFLSRKKDFRLPPVDVMVSEIISGIGELKCAEVFNNSESNREIAASAQEHFAETAILRIFRQTFLYLFEEEVLIKAAEKKFLSWEELCGMWVENQRTLYGEGIEIPDSYGGFWLSVPHFFHFPLYGLNYAIGSLSAIGFNESQISGEIKSTRFASLLKDGGGLSASEWFKIMGREPLFLWQKGLDLL